MHIQIYGKVLIKVWIQVQRRAQRRLHLRAGQQDRQVLVRGQIAFWMGSHTNGYAHGAGLQRHTQRRLHARAGLRAQRGAGERNGCAWKQSSSRMTGSRPRRWVTAHAQHRVALHTADGCHETMLCCMRAQDWQTPVYTQLPFARS